VLGVRLPLLCAGRPIELRGKIEKYEGREHYVASRLRLLAGGTDASWLRYRVAETLVTSSWPNDGSSELTALAGVLSHRRA